MRFTVKLPPELRRRLAVVTAGGNESEFVRLHLDRAVTAAEKRAAKPH